MSTKKHVLPFPPTRSHLEKINLGLFLNFKSVKCPESGKEKNRKSGHLKIPGQPEPDVMSGWALVHLQERGGKAKGRMVTHFQSHLFSFTISFFLSLSLSFNAQIKSQKIDPMPKIGLLDRSRERSADPNIKYYMAGLFLDWLKSYFQWKQTSRGLTLKLAQNVIKFEAAANAKEL